MVASQPHRSPSSKAISSSAKTCATCRNMSAAAVRPSVTSTAKPSSSRSDGRGAHAGGRADLAARDTSPARELASEQCGGPCVQIGVARERDVSGSSCCAALRRSAGASLPAFEAKAICPRNRSNCARLSSSSGPDPAASAVSSNSRAASNAPACRFACAAASARSARRVGDEQVVAVVAGLGEQSPASGHGAMELRILTL
jgi:hypothetical protein